MSIILFLIFCCSYAQEKDRVIARVGNIQITESEFNERFDFSIHPGLLQNSNRDSVKFDFLKQLIAEKLLSLEAHSKGFDTLSSIRDILTPLENMYVRDMLYQHEIKNRVIITPDEIKTGLNRIKNVLKLKFIFSKDLPELKIIHKQLSAGASFDSLLSLREESRNQSLPREITFGTMEKEIEDSVYKLRPGEFTRPLQSKDGYYILKLTEVNENIQNKSNEEIAEDVRRIISARNEFKHYLEYYRNFFSRYRISADREIFEAIIPQFLIKLRQKYSQPDTTGKIILSGSEVTSASEGLNRELISKTFIEINDKDVKIKYFLNQLSHEGFLVSEVKESNVRGSLSSYIRKFIEDELLTGEARRKGLDENEDIKKYMRMWKDSYLSKIVMLNIFDSLKTVKPEIKESTKHYSEQVNIIEVLTDSLGIMEKVINEIEKGENLRILAKRYTIRDSVKNRGGESGFFPVTKNGELGIIASRLKIGDIYGPVKLDEGYSIFQLIDRKIDSSAAYDRGSNSDEFIMNSALENFENYVNAYAAKLAVKYGVAINNDVLKSTDNTFINLIVVRYMGFGGQIFAVPYTEQFSGWYDVWKYNTGEPKP